MSNSGTIIILLNTAESHACKIVKTEKTYPRWEIDSSHREAATSHFITIYHQDVRDCHAAKVAVENALALNGYRAIANSDYFTAPLPEVLRCVMPVLLAQDRAARKLLSGEAENPMEFELDDSKLRSKKEATRIFELAREHENGTGFNLKDTTEALRLYVQAASLGHADAALAAGEYYRIGEHVPAEPIKSMQYYKQAVACGEYLGYTGMADLFTAAGQFYSASKCWASLLEHQQYHEGWLLIYLNYLTKREIEVPHLVPDEVVLRNINELRDELAENWEPHANLRATTAGIRKWLLLLEAGKSNEQRYLGARFQYQKEKKQLSE